ncbi:TorF family putative porin [uncultured Piscinibacter sp.]|uniref:TorF family putative porin n=1 Tax=uncultured Piscinibacter sp. TaxID=1131835 RepID=UPI002609B903|nr:TorF family putative porin [uncultured Piscinibacter sp.]
MKKSILAFAALAVFAGAAAADGLSANVSVVSKYKYRGQDQSDPLKDVVPAIQGGFDYTMGGLYLGNWNSSIGFGGGTEMDFYGGYKGEAGGVGYDVGLLTYYYPGTGADVANTTEIYGAVSYSIATLKYSHVVSKDYFGYGDLLGGVKGRGTGYLDLSLNYEVAKGLTLNGHVGFTKLASELKDGGLVNYTDYKVGATYDLGDGLSVSGAYVGANKKDVWGDLNKGRVVVALSKAM